MAVFRRKIRMNTGFFDHRNVPESLSFAPLVQFLCSSSPRKLPPTVARRRPLARDVGAWQAAAQIGVTARGLCGPHLLPASWADSGGGSAGLRRCSLSSVLERRTPDTVSGACAP